MNQKIIIFKVPEFPHVSETFIVAQIVTAIKLGYEIKILVRRLVENSLAIDNSLVKQYRLLDKIIIEDYKIPKNKFSRVITWLKLLILNISDLKYIIKFHYEHLTFSLTWLYQWYFYKQFNSASIIHVQYGTNKHPFDLLKKTAYFKPKLIVTFHGHDAFFPINGFIPNNGYYDYLFKYADLITANTPYLANKIKALGCLKEKIEIIPVGADTDFFYPLKENKLNDEPLRLITVGRLDKVKGHQYSIEAIKKLVSKGNEVSYTIIGEGDEYDNLASLISKYQLEDKIFLIGSKSQEEIREELRKHNVYLLTAVGLPNGSKETQGLATLEAQSCGLPVIVFNSGGIKYTLEKDVTGFICEEYDVDCICSNIIKFIENPDLLQEMGNEATIFVDRNYSQKVIDNKWENIYYNLSNEK